MNVKSERVPFVEMTCTALVYLKHAVEGYWTSVVKHVQTAVNAITDYVGSSEYRHCYYRFVPCETN